ncbi:MAG: hypothetical protein E6G35_10895 [Actinobacteria bacterium]|nr:MAG: hypothetical protein E6G35_10895 [Actinomycetota bacterium]
MMGGVGELMTLDLPPDSPLLELPWIITIAPAAEEEQWDAVVVGPYERAHALALAEEIVTDEPLLAVVEPVTPHVSVEAIREEIAVARAAALEHAGEEEDDDADSDVDYEDEEDDEHEHHELPSPEEVQAGIARVAARLLTEHISEA